MWHSLLVKRPLTLRRSQDKARSDVLATGNQAMTEIVHHHIFKNAGTTVEWVLQRNFPGQVLHIEGDQPGARLMPERVKSVADGFSEHKAISSHTFPLTDAQSAWASVHLVVLRDPIERYYSMYRYERSRETPRPANIAARQKDFGEYCKWWLSNAPGIWIDWQTRCCTPQSKRASTPLAGAPPKWVADLSAALEAVSNTAYAMTVDRFDEGLVVLEDRLHQSGIHFDASYIRQNVSPRESDGGREELLSEAFRAELVAANAGDYALIQRVRDLVDDRYRELDPSGERLAEFRRRCAALAGNCDALQVRVPGQSDWIVIADSGP